MTTRPVLRSSRYGGGRVRAAGGHGAGQLGLFRRAAKSVGAPNKPDPTRLTERSTLPLAIKGFEIHLRSRGAKPRTVVTYARDLRLLARYLKDKPVGEVNVDDLKAFGAWLRDRRTSEGRIKRNTIGRVITAVRSLYAFLNETKVLATSPAHQALLPTDEEGTLEKPLKRGEITEAFKAWAAKPRHYVLGALLLRGGLTRSELLGLKVEDVDLENRFQPEIVVNASDTKRLRRVSLPADFAAAFSTYVGETRLDATERLFPVSERFLNMMLEEMGNTAGLKHSLTARVCFNTHLAECIRSDMTDPSIAAALGRAPLKHSPRLAAKLSALRRLAGK